VPHYALLAFGRVRLISGLHVGSGILLTLLIIFLVPTFGLTGAAIGRVAYSLLLAIPYLLASRKAFQSRTQLSSVGIF
jgi:O-antigen/teichoic acid export membrane protein